MLAGIVFIGQGRGFCTIIICNLGCYSIQAPARFVSRYVYRVLGKLKGQKLSEQVRYVRYNLTIVAE
jgi:hypothetical protein